MHEALHSDDDGVRTQKHTLVVRVILSNLESISSWATIVLVHVGIFIIWSEAWTTARDPIVQWMSLNISSIAVIATAAAASVVASRIVVALLRSNAERLTSLTEADELDDLIRSKRLIGPAGSTFKS